MINFVKMTSFGKGFHITCQILLGLHIRLTQFLGVFICNDFVQANVPSFALSTDDVKPFRFCLCDCKKHSGCKGKKCGKDVSFVFWFWAT